MSFDLILNDSFPFLDYERIQDFSIMQNSLVLNITSSETDSYCSESMSDTIGPFLTPLS